jgi:hypothetical protein
MSENYDQREDAWKSLKDAPAVSEVDEWGKLEAKAEACKLLPFKDREIDLIARPEAAELLIAITPELILRLISLARKAVDMEK